MERDEQNKDILYLVFEQAASLPLESSAEVESHLKIEDSFRR